MLLLHKQNWVDDVSDLELKQLIIEVTYWLKLEERDRFQIKLITDYKSQLTMNEWIDYAASVN